MIVGFKDSLKLFGIAIIACCLVFVCTLFLNYNIDLVSIKNEITTDVALAMYNAQVSMGKVTVAVTSLCLVATSVIMLFFYIKNYIDEHHMHLGILKAMGYSNFKIAKHFWVFGLTTLIGCVLGFIMGLTYLPTFYKVQNENGLFPHFGVKFHPSLIFILIIIPSIVFTLIAILYAIFRLKRPVLDLIYERQNSKVKIGKKDTKDTPFLNQLTQTNLQSKKILVFFIAFSSFCFSGMVQMAISMKKLSAQSFAWMILIIGLILAFTTLFLSLSTVVKGNIKTIAIMRVLGYQNKTCTRCTLGIYRPISYIGFTLGTVYQYGLLKIVMTFVFNDIENMPEYHFSVKGLIITLVIFVLVYELVMYLYALRIRKLSINSIMMN